MYIDACSSNANATSFFGGSRAVGTIFSPLLSALRSKLPANGRRRSISPGPQALATADAAPGNLNPSSSEGVANLSISPRTRGTKLGKSGDRQACRRRDPPGAETRGHRSKSGPAPLEARIMARPATRAGRPGRAAAPAVTQASGSAE